MTNITKAIELGIESKLISKGQMFVMHKNEVMKGMSKDLIFKIYQMGMAHSRIEIMSITNPISIQWMRE